MRIGIDARLWGKGYGIARYIEQLFSYLFIEDSADTFFLFVLPEQHTSLEQFVAATGVDMSRIRIVDAPIPWYSLREQLFFSRILSQHPVDLMHFPHWNVPVLYAKPFVVTIHDLTMFHFPRPDATTRGKIVYALKHRAHVWLLMRIAKKAKHIFVTSLFTKQDVHATLGVPLDRMTVTYQSPYKGEAFLSNTHKDLHWEDILGKYGISGWYALYVGAAYPHKNLIGLLQAWKRFEQLYGSYQYQLVLVGKKNDFYDRLLSSPEMKACKHVVYTGFLSDQELSFLYSQASLFVFPSLSEGFGIPPLEAMMHAIPVISSDRSSLPEILGEGALYVDTTNQEQFADAIHTVFTDDDTRMSLRQKGRDELKRYTPAHLAQATLQVYREMLRDISS